MDNVTLEQIVEYSRSHRRKKRWRTVLTALAAVVVFITTYILILPAITMDNDPLCGMSEHMHTDECYGNASVLSCNASPHEHSAQCYSETGDIICGYSDKFIHTHTEQCFSASGELLCELEELCPHVHTDECYALDDDLETYVTVCGKEELTPHIHNDECYSDGALICGKLQITEHIHNEQCISSVTSERTLVCGMQEHMHHEIACYSDHTAGVESKDEWESELDGIILTGMANRDVLLIAQSQLDYCESTVNVGLDEYGRLHGYTRYGEWYGKQYCEWSATFASFCLNYAGVKGMPFGDNCNEWASALASEEYGLYRRPSEHTPYIGEIVFFDNDGDGAADKAAIVAEVVPQVGTEGAKLKVIQGDCINRVQYAVYELYSDLIIGYSALPEGDHKQQTLQAQIFTDGTYKNEFEADDTIITVSGMLPKNGKVYAYPVTSVGDDTICAYDITVFDKNGNAFQPFEGESLDVLIRTDKLSGDAFEDGVHPEVYYIPSDGEPERMATDRTQNGIEFSTDHFSVYAVRAVSETSVGSMSQLNNAINNNAQYIRITKAFTVNSTLNIGWGKTITLDLNGKTLTYSGTSDAMFKVSHGGTLTILDSQQPGESVTNVTATPTVYGREATLSLSGDAATLTYYVTRSTVTNAQTGATEEALYKHTVTTSGAIKGNSQPIVSMDGGTFNLEGGMLRSGTNRAIYNNYSGGNITLSGGYICGFTRSFNEYWNDQNEFGGAIFSASGTLTLSGDAVIAANKTGCGGGIAVLGSNKLNINGGIVSGNVSLFNLANVDYHAGGGGIMAADQSEINMTAGYVTNNTANGQSYLDGGGGIFIRGNSKFTISGGYVTGNKAQGGGGIKTKSGDPNIFNMNGGFFSGNLATQGEGAGICIELSATAYVNAGYITNNVLENTEHWGGGGLFCANNSTVYMRNLLVTDNSAGGFSGGISGCPTGRLYLYVNEGCAVFGNNDIVDDDGIHFVSGGTKDGIDVVRCDELFQACGHADYFSAMQGTVLGTMLGGGSAEWRGSADHHEVSASKDELLVSNEVMGLQSHPSDADKQLAYDAAKLYMNGNYSYTHGGAIMCNGNLIVGIPQDITVSSKVTIKASKAFFKGGTAEELSLENNDFQFSLIDSYLNGTVLENATCDSEGIIAFDHLIELSEDGTYFYYLKEIPKTDDNTILYDNSIYRIRLSVALNDGEDHIQGTKKFTYQINSMTIDKSTDDGLTWSEYKSTSSPQGGSVVIDLSTEKTFVNRTMEFTKLTVKKEWQGPIGAEYVTVILKQNGAEYDRVTLSASNQWTYTWSDLPQGYEYTVHEITIKGYEAIYTVLPGEVQTVQRPLGSGTWWVPAKTLEKGSQYIIVSADGKKALCVTQNHVDSAFTAEDVISVSMQNSTITLNGVQYSAWMPYDKNIASGALFTPQDRDNKAGLALKSGVGSSWLLAQSAGGNYLKGTNNITYSSMVVLQNGMLMCNNEFANEITSLRPVVFADGKFDTVDSQSPLNAVKFLTPVSGTPTVTETLVQDAIVVITNSGAPVYELPETGGNGVYVYYISGCVMLLAAGAYLVYRKIKSGKEDTASF